MADLKLYRAFYRSSSPTPTVGTDKWIFAFSQDEARDFLLEELKTLFYEELSAELEDERMLLEGWELQEHPVAEGVVKMGPDIESLEALEALEALNLYGDQETDSS